jgi:hypothetical protein
MAEPVAVRSVTELGSITKGRPGPARHSRTPGVPPTGPAVGGAGLGPSQKADRARPDTPHGCDGARRKTVVCLAGEGDGGGGGSLMSE